MARHHDDPDAAFRGWCDVWLDPAFRDWSLEPEASAVTRPALLIQGADDPYGTLDQLDRIEARVRGPVERLVVPGGHSPHLEAADEVLVARERWVRERGLPRRCSSACAAGAAFQYIRDAKGCGVHELTAARASARSCRSHFRHPPDLRSRPRRHLRDRHRGRRERRRLAAVADQRLYAVGTNNDADFLCPVTVAEVEVLAAPGCQAPTQQLWDCPSRGWMMLSSPPGAACGWQNLSLPH